MAVDAIRSPPYDIFNDTYVAPVSGLTVNLFERVSFILSRSYHYDYCYLLYIEERVLGCNKI